MVEEGGGNRGRAGEDWALGSGRDGCHARFPSCNVKLTFCSLPAKAACGHAIKTEGARRLRQDAGTSLRPTT